MTDWQELEQKYYTNTFRRVPVVLVRGAGARVWDDKGREYLDFVGGLAVNSLGHCHPAVTAAVCKQVNTLLQVSNLYYSIPQLQLAELLVQNSALDKVFFCNSGAEANEGALLLARKYGKLYMNGAGEIITTINSFHGRTLAMVAATGQKRFKEPYEPLPGGFVNVEYDNIEAIKAATTSRTCAVMLEPIQGEGGVNIPDDNYLKEVRNWCDEKGMLLILDEVQTGIGRIGTLFGYQQSGIEPDIMTLAKGLGSGMPVAAIMAKEKASVFVPGDHGSTFGGNLVTCAAGYATLKYILDNDVVGNARVVGKYLMKKLEELKSKYDFIINVRGRGLLVALQLDSEISADVVRSCFEMGLLLNVVKPDTVRFIPPLIITGDDVNEAVNILDSVLDDIK